MKNLFIISAILAVLYGCGSPQSSDPNQPPSNCISLSGGLVSNITGTWKVDAKATSYPNEVFNFSTDNKRPGVDNGVCTGMGPCYEPHLDRETRWSVSGNSITFTGGTWYMDGVMLKYWVYNQATYYYEVGSNTLTLEYVTNNTCTAPFNSTRQ